MKWISALLTASLLTACATSAVKPEQATPVPADRVYTATTGQYPITVTRDEGHMGSGCFLDLFIDDKRVATFDPRETLTLYTDKTRVLLVGVKIIGEGLCSIENDINYLEAHQEQGKHKLYRIHINNDGRGPQVIPGGYAKPHSI